MALSRMLSLQRCALSCASHFENTAKTALPCFCAQRYCAEGPRSGSQRVWYTRHVHLREALLKRGSRRVYVLHLVRSAPGATANNPHAADARVPPAHRQPPRATPPTRRRATPTASRGSRRSRARSLLSLTAAPPARSPPCAPEAPPASPPAPPSATPAHSFPAPSAAALAAAVVSSPKPLCFAHGASRRTCSGPRRAASAGPSAAGRTPSSSTRTGCRRSRIWTKRREEAAIWADGPLGRAVAGAL